MNISKFTYLINKPDAINDTQTIELEKILQEFPYFQSARALFLKGLYNQDSFKYNHVLKTTAAHTTERGVLFDFITSDTFTAIHKELYDKKVAEIKDITVLDSEIVEIKLEVRENTVEQSILNLIKESGSKEIQSEETLFLNVTRDKDSTADLVSNDEESVSESDHLETANEKEEIVTDLISGNHSSMNLSSEESTTDSKLNLGKPLEFSESETHSFQEWLQLSNVKPIVREENVNNTKEIPNSEIDLGKQKKNELIDRFIQINPKIPAVKQNVENFQSFITEPSNADNSYLMTETLARVYLEQKKYQKAIQAYEILILKYPEKSSFFADRILDIKHLQQNNK